MSGNSKVRPCVTERVVLPVCHLELGARGLLIVRRIPQHHALARRQIRFPYDQGAVRSVQLAVLPTFGCDNPRWHCGQRRCCSERLRRPGGVPVAWNINQLVHHLVTSRFCAQDRRVPSSEAQKSERVGTDVCVSCVFREPAFAHALAPVLLAHFLRDTCNSTARLLETRLHSCEIEWNS